MFSGMGMQRAIGTSLLVITLISISGTASHLLAGKDLSLATAVVFTAGGALRGCLPEVGSPNDWRDRSCRRFLRRRLSWSRCTSFFALFHTITQFDTRSSIMQV